MEIKALSWVFLTKVRIGNPNASFTEGNVQTAKKITAIDGSEYLYISSQCQKHGMRERLSERGIVLSTPVDGKVETTLGDPVNYIDDDIFGYLIPNEQRKRTAPLRVAPLISLFPYKGDRDFMTKTRKASDQGGNIIETEIYSNIMCGGGMLELDRVGVFDESEIKEQKTVPNDVKRERVKVILDVLKNFWAGGKQTNFLNDISPKFIVFCFQKVKIPFLLESLLVDKNGKILVSPLKETIKNYKEIIDSVIIGKSHVFDFSEINDLEIDEITIESKNLSDAFESVKNRIDEIYKENQL